MFVDCVMIGEGKTRGSGCSKSPPTSKPILPPKGIRKEFKHEELFRKCLAGFTLCGYRLSDGTYISEHDSKPIEFPSEISFCGRTFNLENIKEFPDDYGRLFVNVDYN